MCEDAPDLHQSEEEREARGGGIILLCSEEQEASRMIYAFWKGARFFGELV